MPLASPPLFHPSLVFCFFLSLFVYCFVAPGPLLLLLLPLFLLLLLLLWLPPLLLVDVLTADDLVNDPVENVKNEEDEREGHP